jgi:5'-3' exonuclease
MKLLLVDGSSVAVRRFYALGGKDALDTAWLRDVLINAAEESTRSILRRADIERFGHVRVALETPITHPVWRYVKYADYKRANTPRFPVAAALQPHLVRACRRDSLSVVYAYHMEADDVIATMVRQAHGWLAEGDRSIAIWTADRDLWQLLNPDQRVTIIVEGKHEEIGFAEARDILGIDPRAIPTLKALAGDKSDNLKGVRNVGPKAAQKLIRPAPYRLPTPYTIDLSDAKPELKREILQEHRRVLRDERLACLRSDAELRTDPNEYLAAYENDN